MSELAISLFPDDLRWDGWHRALGPAIKTLILHGSADGLKAWSFTLEAKTLLARMADRGVKIEFVMHIGSELLPRKLFRKSPELFRMNECWERTPDANLCPSNPDVEAVLAKHIQPYLEALRPTTGRYLLAPDDNRPWCFCRQCRALTWSDQNLLFTNMLARILRTRDSAAQVAYFAYKPCIDPPITIKPEHNVFLVFAPIERDYRHALVGARTAKDAYFKLVAKELLACFGSAGSLVLEYWLDVSMFSHWMLPRREIPVSASVMQADLAYYHSIGFEYIASFGVGFDSGYVRQFGEAPLNRWLKAWKRVALRCREYPHTPSEHA